MKFSIEEKCIACFGKGIINKGTIAEESCPICQKFPIEEEMRLQDILDEPNEQEIMEAEQFAERAERDAEEEKYK